MASAPEVLLLDDGELDDVQEILDVHETYGPPLAVDHGRLVLLVFAEEPVRELVLSPGQSFKIGDTNFQVLSGDAVDHESLLVERAFGEQELSCFSFGDGEKRLEALSRLPEIFSSAGTRR